MKTVKETKERKVTVTPWGACLGIRLPKDITDALKIDKEIELECELRNGQIVLTPPGYSPSKSDYLEEGLQILAQALPKSSNIEIVPKKDRS